MQILRFARLWIPSPNVSIPAITQQILFNESIAPRTRWKVNTFRALKFIVYGKAETFANIFPDANLAQPGINALRLFANFCPPFFITLRPWLRNWRHILHCFIASTPSGNKYDPQTKNCNEEIYEKRTTFKITLRKYIERKENNRATMYTYRCSRERERERERERLLRSIYWWSM